MKRALRIFFIIGGVGITGILILGSLSGCENAKAEETIIARHCDLNWETADAPTKLQVLKEFGAEGGIEKENTLPLSLLAYNLLKKSVKYPESIIIDGDKPQGFILFGNNYTIASVPDGLIDFRKNFTAKNKLNMDVRMQMFMQVKYTAGCKGFEVTQFNVE